MSCEECKNDIDCLAFQPPARLAPPSLPDSLLLPGPPFPRASASPSSCRPRPGSMKRDAIAMLSAFLRRDGAFPQHQLPPLLPPPRNERTSLASAPSAWLPDEILLSIFGHLSHARDIAAVRGVCTAWRALVDDSQSIWRTLVFDLPRCPSSAPYAEVWYRKAADYGNAQAQFLLALLYTYGYSGCPRQAAFPSAF